ncbi:MAG: GTP-binding protein [bacterium]|nr:GTP-binding protein [bacterium]
MENKNKNLKPRPPIVVVMGHVDHGKTTLLDSIRKANVAGREAGGITQAIGAYEITHNLRKVTFIDTPGHEAFTAMRARGARIADLAILVVAAEDGVKPQTKEAIDILHKTETPFVVAINKIDKTGGDIERVKNDLMSAEVFLEGFGGQTSYHGISAKTGEGVNELLDLVILTADVEGLICDSFAPASGYILEAKQGNRRGIEATLILRDGVLRRGDEIFTRTAKGKVKILENFLGEVRDSLEPSSPAIVVGFESLPGIGDEFLVGSPPEKSVAAKENIGAVKKENDLSVILKSSDAGSLEVLSSVIGALTIDDKGIFIAGGSVGDITDGDVKSAVATGAIVVGFKIKTNKAASNLAEGQNATIVTSDIIYELVKSVEEIISGRGKQKPVAELGVLAIFNQKKLSEQLVGGVVRFGVFRVKASFEIMRSNELVGTGRILSLRKKKEDINSAEEGAEIGMVADSKVKLEAGDVLAILK